MLGNQLALDLPMSAAAPALARRAIASLGLGDGARENAILLASELVSNSLRHSGARADATIHLSASVADGALRMSVTDDGGGFVLDPSRQPGIDGGFGLFLVNRLATAWGVATDARTTVWLELGLPPA
ncbi:MAG: ATP-binding protein [Actinobacteria bacterium]|nr:ATP-binding protein [Actinomycetota bacterium]